MIGERLKQAREIRGMTQESLAAQANVSQATIATIERDAFQPRADIVARIAEVTGFPLDFFELPIEKDFPLGSLVYRKFARMKAEHKKLSHRLAQQAFELSEFLALQLKPIPVHLPRTTDEAPASAAQIVRSALGVDSTSPIKNLVQRVERLGVRVFLLPDDVPDLDAFSILIEGRQPVVVLNPARSGDRQLFSLAHELGHLVMHYPFTRSQDDIEREAHEFAAELLLPAEAMQVEIVEPVTLTTLAELKSRWRTSIAALLQRAKDLNKVTERQYKYLRAQLSKRDWLKSEPVEVPPERPASLRRMAEVVYGTPINIRRIARDAARPDFLVARLLGAAAAENTRDNTRVLGFPPDGRAAQ